MNIEVANRLQQLRKAKGLSQEELAQILGLSRQAISKWERAETSPDTDNLVCLARLYNISIDSLLSTDESIEEIKERIAQERINEIDKEKDEIEKTEDETIDPLEENIIKEDSQIISNDDIKLDEEQEAVKKKKDNIVGIMYSSSLVIGIITWIIISQDNADSWKWGWVFGVMAMGFVFSFEQVFAKRSLNLLGIGFSCLVFYVAFSICVDFDLEVNRIVVFIGIGIIALQVVIQMITYIVFFRKNRKTTSEVYYKEQLIEIKHQYEAKIEKLKSKIH